jgi:hypothetical protein
VTGHDNVEASSSRIDVDFLHVVKDVNADSLQLQSEVERDLRGPRALVVVSPDRVDRRYGAQLFENLGVADVARMDDVLNARECPDRFGAKQSVRIGDEAYRFQWIVRAAQSGDRSPSFAAVQKPVSDVASVPGPLTLVQTVVSPCRRMLLVADSNFRQHGRH